MKKLIVAAAGLVALFGCTTKTEPAREPLRVTLTFDDGLKDHILVAVPMLEAHGWRGTFNLVTDWIGKDADKLTWDEARELVVRGHELAVHTKTHPAMPEVLRTKGDAAARAEVALARDAIADRTGFAPRLYCAPFGQANAETDRIVREEGLEPYSLGGRYEFGKGATETVREALLKMIANGVKRVDLLHHGIVAKESGGHGGYRPFADRAAFERHLDAIAALEREGKIAVTDYHGAVSNCKLKAKAWPHHGVIALSFDDLHLEAWERAFPLFAKYGGRATFFLTSSIGTNEIAFARKAMLAGHEVGLHGLEHRNADQYVAEKGLADYWNVEVAPQLEAFRAVGIRPRSFAYPNCRRTPETDELFRSNGFVRVRGLCDGIPNVAPCDPYNVKAAQRRPIAECDSEFLPAEDYLTVFRIRNVIMGEYYQTDIEDIVRAMRRAGERGEMLSLVSHGIAPNAGGINMKTEWLERMLSEADEAGVIVRGVR